MVGGGAVHRGPGGAVAVEVVGGGRVVIGELGESRVPVAGDDAEGFGAAGEFVLGFGEEVAGVGQRGGAVKVVEMVAA